MCTMHACKFAAFELVVYSVVNSLVNLVVNLQVNLVTDGGGELWMPGGWSNALGGERAGEKQCGLDPAAQVTHSGG